MLDRRKVLGGGVVLGGSAWVAPTLLSTPAHAQGTNPTTTTDPPPTTEVPPGFAPVALAGLFTLEGTTSHLVADAQGHLRMSTDGGGSWTDPLGGGTVGVAPIGLTFGLAVGANGEVRRGNEAATEWVDETPLDISPVAVTPETFGRQFLAVDSAGAVRSASTAQTPLVWSDPLAGGTIGISPVAINNLYGAIAAVDAAGHIRISLDDGVTWYDPMGGGTIGISPVAVIGAVRVPVIRYIEVMDAGGNRRTSSNGSTWGSPSATPGLSSVVALWGVNAPVLAVDSVGNVRTYSGGNWTTPAGSPIT